MVDNEGRLQQFGMKWMLIQLLEHLTNWIMVFYRAQNKRIRSILPNQNESPYERDVKRIIARCDMNLAIKILELNNLIVTIADPVAINLL